VQQPYTRKLQIIFAKNCTVRLETKLSIFQKKTRTKSKQNQNKPQQNHNKISTVLFCCDFFVLIMLCSCCFELENSVNSRTLLSESILNVFSGLQIKIKVTLFNSSMIYNNIVSFCCVLFRLGVLFLLLFCCDFV